MNVLLFSIAIVVLVMFSAFFSATETAFTSLNIIKIKNLAANGNKRAKRTLALAEDYDTLLSTNLIGNNIVNIASASIATLMFTDLLKSQDLGATVSTIVMTIIVLIFGEISPKTLAKESPERFAMAVSGIMWLMTKFFFPLNWLFKQWKRLLVKIVKSSDKKGMSEEELMTIVDEATEQGGLNAEEGELIRSAIEFNDLIVKDIYTPRVNIFALPMTATKEECREMFRETGFSRLPIFEEDIDTIVGIVHEKDFYKEYFADEFMLANCMTNVVCVTMSQNVSQVLRKLQKDKTHMAIVIDEYGGTAGIVTLEDIIEELVGEIWDEHDEVLHEFVDLGEGKYLVKGTLSVEDLYDYLDMRYVDNEFEVETVSGWVMDLFGRMPNIGETVEFNEFKFEVIATEFRRIESVQVSIIKQEEIENHNIFKDLLKKPDERKITETEEDEPSGDNQN